MWAAGTSNMDANKRGRRFSWSGRRGRRQRDDSGMSLVAQYGAFIAALIFLGAGIGVIVYGNMTGNIFFYVLGGVFSAMGVVILLGACYKCALQIVEDDKIKRRKLKRDIEAQDERHHQEESHHHHHHHRSSETNDHHSNGHHSQHHHHPTPDHHHLAVHSSRGPRSRSRSPSPSRRASPRMAKKHIHKSPI